METGTTQGDSKLEVLCHHLRALARENGPDFQLPPTRVLCKMFHTTHVTLNDALNILETERIVYRKQRQGIFVSPAINHKSIHILFFADNFAEPASPFWNMLWMELERESQKRRAFKEEFYTFHLVHAMENPEYSIPEHISLLFRTQRVDGVLAVGFHIRGIKLLAQKIPYVVFAGEGAQEVRLDENRMIHQAVEILMQQQCERIGMWIQKFAFISFEEREDVQYFKQKLVECRKTVYPGLIRTSHALPSQRFLSLQEQGYLLAREIFGKNNNEKPDGLIIRNDMMTDGALIAFDELGIRVGQDVKIVTHANVGSPILFGRTKNMTALEFSPTLLVQAMFSLLEDIMTDMPSKKQIIYIPPQIRKNHLSS